MTPTEIRHKLRTKRGAHISQDRLAERLGISSRQYKRYESGASPIPQTTLEIMMLWADMIEHGIWPDNWPE